MSEIVEVNCLITDILEYIIQWGEMPETLDWYRRHKFVKQEGQITYWHNNIPPETTISVEVHPRFIERAIDIFKEKQFLLKAVNLYMEQQHKEIL